MRTVNSKTNNFVLFAWLILTLSALFVSVHSYRQNGIEHNILALVPEDAVDKRIDETNRNFLTSLERTLFFALSDETAAKDLKTRLEDSGVCQAVFGQIQPDKQRAIYAFLNSHRLAFIDPSTRDLLANPQAYSAWVMAQVFNPFAGIGHAELSGDPLLLIRRAQSSLAPSGNAALKKGWIVAVDKTGKTFYLVEASLKNGISVTDAVVSVNQILKTVQKDHPGTLALRQGIPFYTASGLESAKDDVSVLGTLSLVGLLAIFWLAFRSIRPFLLCAVSLLTGLIFATAATYLVFDSVHAAALVMSTSLIGISADYTTYYLTRRMRFGLSDHASCSPTGVAPICPVRCRRPDGLVLDSPDCLSLSCGAVSRPKSCPSPAFLPLGQSVDLTSAQNAKHVPDRRCRLCARNRALTDKR